MDIYDITKTKKLNPDEIDNTKGYVYDDVLTIHHNEVKEILESPEKGHYETIVEYPNGGKDVEWVVDKPKVEYVAPQEAYDEEIPILIFKEYTEKEQKQIQIQQELDNLKSEIASTDYEALKYAEGWFTEEEYVPIKAEREAIRVKIRELEELLQE